NILRGPIELLFNDSSARINIAVKSGVELCRNEEYALCQGIVNSILKIPKAPLIVVDKRKERDAHSSSEEIRKILNESEFNRILIIAHSQGTDIITKAIRHLDEDERRRITVITAGGLPIGACAG